MQIHSDFLISFFEASFNGTTRSPKNCTISLKPGPKIMYNFRVFTTSCSRIVLVFTWMYVVQIANPIIFPEYWRRLSLWRYNFLCIQWPWIRKCVLWLKSLNKESLSFRWQINVLLYSYWLGIFYGNNILVEFGVDYLYLYGLPHID